MCKMKRASHKAEIIIRVYVNFPTERILRARGLLAITITKTGDDKMEMIFSVDETRLSANPRNRGNVMVVSSFEYIIHM